MEWLATLAGNRSLSCCGFLPGLKPEVSTEILMKFQEKREEEWPEVIDV